MKARTGLPAKTMSRGSSPTRRVRTTRGMGRGRRAWPAWKNRARNRISRFVGTRKADDAHAVGKMIHYPEFAVAARRHGYRFEANGDSGRGRRAFPASVSKISSVPFGVFTAKSVEPSGEIAKRTHLPAFELDERRSCGQSRGVRDTEFTHAPAGERRRKYGYEPLQLVSHADNS